MKKSKRTIACMTGTRADYPRVKSVLREIEGRPNLRLELIVTGMHLLEEFGYTLREIEKDGFKIAAQVEMYGPDDTPYGMAKAAAKCSNGMADALRAIRPDIFLITVDRVETLAAAQTAALMNIPIAHIQGGEVTGTVDESIRHAVSKLSHIHFPATEDAAQRLTRMGEDPKHVHAVGCPYLDIIRTLDYQTKKSLSSLYQFNPHKKLVLFTQHPVTTEYGQGSDQIKRTLEVLSKISDVEVIAIYSNADAGGREIIDIMTQHSQFHVFANITDSDFLSLMKNADLMIGNSSSGIREAPSFGLPVINIGTRQQGRLRAGNVLDVPHDPNAITEAIHKALYDEKFIKKARGVFNPYGDGHSAKRIVDLLEEVSIGRELQQKRISY